MTLYAFIDVFLNVHSPGELIGANFVNTLLFAAEMN